MVYDGTRTVLGLPTQVRVCLFDLDGVLTRTATAHKAAWAEMFDEFLWTRADERDPFRAYELLAGEPLTLTHHGKLFELGHEALEFDIPKDASAPRPKQPAGREPAVRR